VPVLDVTIFATTLAPGILLDATVVRGVLVAAMGRANWEWPGARPPRRRVRIAR
jgi:RND superfamily putative drug exporter